MKRHAQDLKLERERLKQQNTRELIKIGELRQELAELNIEININNFMPRADDDSDSDSITGLNTSTRWTSYQFKSKILHTVNYYVVKQIKSVLL